MPQDVSGRQTPLFVGGFQRCVNTVDLTHLFQQPRRLNASGSVRLAQRQTAEIVGEFVQLKAANQFQILGACRIIP